tara:strand:+ start:352 stop:567 length:216 start_codon:yes stop_codon:yes gene_type:complete
MKQTEILPGDLVVWLNEFESGNILETGVAVGLENGYKVKHVKGAWVAWKSGVYWSPLKQIVKVDDKQSNNS